MSDINATLNERGATYGEFMGQAIITLNILRTLEEQPGWEHLRPDMREALHMIASKMARIVNGDPYHADSWHDIAGYATLIERTLHHSPPPAPGSLEGGHGA